MSIRDYLKFNPIAVFLYRLPYQLLSIIARFFPLQRKIVFDNFGGRGLGDDPKYILLQLMRDSVKAKFVWLLNDLSTDVPAGVIKVKKGSLMEAYHYATAKIWIDNVKFVSKPRKRIGQFYLQTWHGFFSTKMVERDVESILPLEYIKASKADSSKIDLMYANNDLYVEMFKRAFWYSGQIIKAGSPHLSTVINPPQGLKEQIFSKFNLPQGKKIVLYAPTFRKTLNIDDFKWDYNIILKEIEKKYNEEYIFLVRFHPNISAQMASFADDVFYNTSNYPDVTELLAVSDILISDLSSVVYDMAIRERPVFLFMKDLGKYIETDRIQYLPIEELPFPIAQTEAELVKNISQFDENDYKNKIHAFFDKIGLSESGNGAIIISDILKEKLG